VSTGLVADSIQTILTPVTGLILGRLPGAAIRRLGLAIVREPCTNSNAPAVNTVHAIATHCGRPDTPTDQAHIESLFGHRTSMSARDG
jgi:hypothetical protein